MKRVLLIVGTPGVGKSLVSALLASLLNGLHVNLSSLIEEENLSCGFDEKREVPIADIERISQRVYEVIRLSEGYVIVDGHFAMDVVAAECIFLIFVLRRNPDELVEILNRRGYPEGKVMENVAAEILDVCLFDSVKAVGKDRVCEIDVSSKEIHDIAKQIVSVVNGCESCHVGIVDWLTKLEIEGRLDRFLAYL